MSEIDGYHAHVYLDEVVSLAGFGSISRMSRWHARSQNHVYSHTNRRGACRK
jgi:hypothetical protein